MKYAAGMLQRLQAWIFRRPLLVYDPAYRWPLSGLEGAFDLRRADLVTWHLVDRRAYRPAQVLRPTPASYDDLALVHDGHYLESLTRPEALASIFACSPSDVRVDELMGTIRLACGGTMLAARRALSRSLAVLNTSGGFHHAAPARGAGFCAVNDVAVSIAALRRDGFSDRVAVLDLDAHPPDGTAECLRRDPKTWLGSLSGPGWPLPADVEDTVLPKGCDDATYLAALEALLENMPPSALTFVLAGGDVLQGDRLGQLGLTLEGCRRRDALVLDKLAGRASVWLPAGGYSDDAWRALAGTALVLAGLPRSRIPETVDPLRSHFADVALQLSEETFAPLTEADLGFPTAPFRLLGFYSREAIEHAFARYGLWKHVERLGYQGLRVEIAPTGTGDRMRLLGRAQGKEHVLVETVVERRHIAGRPVLFVNWLTLRDPLSRFTETRPQLPGQDAPGLGLAREATTLLSIMAQRLGLEGVAFRPSWYHTAYAARHDTQFVTAERQGRFEAQLRDLKDVPLLEATRAFADGRVRMDGQPYAWEPDDMVTWLEEKPAFDEAVLARERQHRFTWVE